MAFFKCVVDKDGTQYTLIPLIECKEAFDYTIPSFYVIIYRGRSESLLPGSSRRCYNYSVAVTDEFIQDTDARIFPTRIAIYKAKL